MPRWIQHPVTLELIPAEKYVRPGSPQSYAKNFIFNDRHYEGMSATDGTPIDSRAKHQEYMRRNGLTTADDFTGEWQFAEKERAAHFTGEKGSFRREDIERAIHQIQERR